MIKNNFGKRSLLNVLFPFLIILTFSFMIKPVSAIDSYWVVTGSMNHSRTGHRSVLLNSGKVLAVGGRSSTTTHTLITELYDPNTGVWTNTGPLNDGRREFLSILLNNGKVLVAGGQNATSILATVELYDPNTGTWTYTGSMNKARYSFASALLPDGKVLVAGGVGSGGIFLDSAEIFDPLTGTWSDTGRMNTTRATIAAILLPDNKVLVAGGENEKFLTSAELFDLTTGTWSYTGSMNTNHHYHPLVMLPNGKVLFAGAPTNSSCELYDPDTGTWSYTGSMNVVRRGAAITALDNGKVLAVGGSIYFGSSTTNTAEVYDPIKGVWENIDPMHNALPGPQATLLTNGTILVSGGSEAELYYYRFSVSVEQALDQADPTNTSPINFTVAFSKPIDVATFTPEDVNLGGTAGATTAVISEIAPNDGTTFNIAVSGMISDGTVTASIPEGRVQSLAGNENESSTSVDNEVVYDTTSPTVTVEKAAEQDDPTNTSPINFTVTFSEPIDLATFTSEDIHLEGSAGATTVVISEIAPNDGTTFNIAVSGMKGVGTVIASIPENRVQDLAGNLNVASTSIDNEVNYFWTIFLPLLLNH